MGTQITPSPLLARTAYTPFKLSLKDTSDIQRESPTRYTNGRIQSCLRKTLNGQRSDPGLGSEGIQSKDTLKMDDSANQLNQTQVQHPVEAMKDKDDIG